MSSKSNIMHKKTSFTALWSAIESIYGEISELIKIVLKVNAFDSFLSFRGIRYDDKNEFFKSLETTVVELGLSTDDTEDKQALDRIFGTNYNYKNFKLKPGHRNLIMNLMLEIDKVDVEDFFNKAQEKSLQNAASTDSIDEKIEENDQKIQRMPVISKSSPRHEVLYQASDHIYTHDDDMELAIEAEYQDNCEEYILEEEYIDEKPSSILKINDLGTEYYEVVDALSSNKKQPAKKRKPNRMYNEEFLSQCINPRRRRVTSSKQYPDNDDGIRQRFCDLIQQSMQCILSQPKLEEIGYANLVVAKESDTSWIVVCPICDARIKLAVVYENNGRYKNYKRSNFERHLRFKHCKEDISDVMDLGHAYH